VREHQEIFEPTQRLFGQVREISTAITHEVGAFSWQDAATGWFPPLPGWPILRSRRWGFVPKVPLRPHPAPMLRSHVSGIVWPALPGATAARMLALQFQHRQFEYCSAAEVAAQQFRQIEALVSFSHQNISYWRDRLRQAGIRPGQKLTQRLWAQLPILTRRQAQEAGAALHATELPVGHGNMLQGATSGSTGMPLRFVKSDLAQLFWLSTNLRQVLWHKLAFHGSIAVIKQMAIGEDITTAAAENHDWGFGFEAFATGPVIYIDSRRPASEQIEWLMDRRPTYVVTRPSNAIRLAARCDVTGHDIPGLQRILAMGEVLAPHTRALCRAVLGVEMIDAYSAEEAGILALQCPDHHHLHAISDVAKLEVLDDRNQPCGPGEIGRVVVTPLHNFAMPLLRYEIGDLAEVGHPCSCGRNLPVLARILGRTNNRITLPNGEVRLAHWGAERMHQIASIIQYQVAQVAPDTMEYRLVVRDPLTTEDEAFLTGMLHRSTGYPFKVRFAYVREIPGTASGKHREFVSELVG
jgi:phenylacetate-CoA ligase